MWLWKRLLLITTLLLSSWASAKNYAVIMGGVEENPGETVFATGYETLQKFRNKTNWRVDYIFGKDLPGSRQDFSKENFLSKISSLKKKISKGQIKAGDQLLIYIDAHGEETDGKQQTHSVLTTSGYVDLDVLIELRDLAESKDVKLAIIDQSCYSGAMLVLATPKTCVATATTTDNLGYSNVGDNFAYFMWGSSDLETAYLLSRNRALSSGQPQISTEAGRKAATVLEVFEKATLEAKFKPNLSLPLRAPAMVRGLLKDKVVYLKATDQASEAAALKQMMSHSEETEIMSSKSDNEKMRHSSSKERQAYSTLYDYFKMHSKEPNPCASFRLN